MTESGEGLQGLVDVLATVTSRVPGGIGGLGAAADADLIEVIRAAEAIVRSARAVVAAAAGEVARRSISRDESSLARRFGERNAAGLVAATAAVSYGEAAQFVRVGEAVRSRASLAGEPFEGRRPVVGAALSAGTLSVPLADVIVRTLDSVARVQSFEEARLLEAALVERATESTWSVADFTAFCRRLPDQIDPDGTEPRNDALVKRAFVTEQTLRSGMLRIVAELDPLRAGFYLAAMRAKTNPRRQGIETPGDDQPTAAERKLDAFTTIMRRSLRADDGASAGVDTTILVRIDLEQLRSEVGAGTVDGVAEPIPASTIRRLAAEADLIPQVFGGTSQLLDQGQSKRLFTKAQRYAILGTFLGCVYPQCDIPSAMTEIHHIGRWATRHGHGSGTDLLNGVPLCPFHNRLMEDDGWDIELDDQRVPWVTPPPHVDPLRRRIRGGHLAGERAA